MCVTAVMIVDLPKPNENHVSSSCRLIEGIFSTVRLVGLLLLLPGGRDVPVKATNHEQAEAHEADERRQLGSRLCDATWQATGARNGASVGERCGG
jgi:hypothetical protein